MKKFNILFIVIFALSLFASCEYEPVGNNEPKVYIPHNWVTENDLWERTDNVYTSTLGVYCGGVVPSRQNSNINVNFEILPSLVDDYNNDPTQEFAGELQLLPADCYKVDGNVAVIKKGNVDATIPIVFDMTKVKAFCTDPAKKYVIPFKLTGTDKYVLHENPQMLVAYYCVNVEKPSFFFAFNEYDVRTSVATLLYGNEKEIKYDIISQGVPDGEYTFKVEVDESVLDSDDLLLPKDAYTLDKTEFQFRPHHDCELKITYDYNKIEFRKTYLLPLRLTSASEYGIHPEKGLLMIKVYVVNEYQKQYMSKMTVNCENSMKTDSYQYVKEITSYEKDIVTMQAIRNNTIAGAGTQYSWSRRFNNQYFNMKIIPTDNKNRYKIEYMSVGGNWGKLKDFEAIEGQDNYYDWDYEKFVLNYRWKDYDETWINATEIVTPQ